MKKYAVIGNPIGHSLSPTMHNAAFRELGADAEYGKLEIEHLMRGYSHLKENYSGINVTIPHKTGIMEMLDQKEMVADLIGAVNCVKFEGGKGFGYNTDLYGAIEALKTELPKLKGKKILLLGAGGAARAILFGCLLEGAEVTLHNRTRKKAEQLTKEAKEKLDKRVKVQDEQSLDGFNAIVNSTSVGMYPGVDETPLTSPIPSNRKLVVMDIVYNPIRTKLLKEAGEAGAKTVDGVEMFIRQGAESLRIWGYEPPLDAMRGAVLKELK
jgi:shikimate dehydrogenase